MIEEPCQKYMNLEFFSKHEKIFQFIKFSFYFFAPLSRDLKNSSRTRKATLRISFVINLVAFETDEIKHSCFGSWGERAIKEEILPSPFVSSFGGSTVTS